MKRHYDNRPAPAERKRRAEQQQRSNAIGMLAAWANDPAQAESPIAQAVRVLLGECSRLADLVPLVETLQLDKAIMGASCNQYRAENARLRALLESEGVSS